MRLNSTPRGTRKKILFVLLAFVFLTEAGFVLAQNSPAGQIAGGVKNIFQWGVGIAGLLSACVVAFGAIHFLIDYGRGSTEKEGKEWIKAGIIGLLLTLGSWVIINTINPDIFNLHLNPLNLGNLQGSSNSNNNIGLQVVNYDEIPLGMLTENLLTKKISCYEFDAQGNPIAGEKIKADNNQEFLGPTYLNHDRIDCYLKLTDAVEKKTLAAENLAKEINKELATCSCKDYGQCDDCSTKNGPAIGNNPLEGKCELSPAIGGCFGDCTKNEACSASGGKKEPDLSCCSPDIRTKIKGYLKTPGDKKADPFEFTFKKECGTVPATADGKAFFTVYAHMQNINVNVGQQVNAGDTIGQIGDVGTDMGAHLHFAVGFENGKSGLDMATSFDISSKIAIPGNAGQPNFTTPLPGYVNQNYKNYVLNSLTAPVDLNNGNWKQQPGSALHNNTAAFAQDWVRQDGLTAGTNVQVMSGGGGIKSTVIAIIPGSGAVIIKHELIDKDALLSLLNGGTSTSGSCDDGILHKYYGLDEFYTTKSNFSDIVEKTVQVDNKDLRYIDLANCPTCLESCQCAPGDQNCVRNQPKCLEDRQKCLTKDRPECLATTPWGKLNLIEQTKYLQEKLDQITSDIKKDLESVNTAGSKLSSCSIVKSYIDLRQTDEATNNKITLLKIKEGEVPISKYCNGFSYSNSECFQKCSDICPITPADVDCYNQDDCKKTCDPVARDYQDCLNKKNKCMNGCYNNTKCTNKNDYPNFKSCLTACNNSCQGLCATKYLTCSEEFKACQSMCDNNSKCLLDNLGSCVLNSASLANCKNEEGDDAINNCINHSYSCKSGSDQNSGYPECLKNPTKEGIFYSSFIWQNQDKQVCKIAESTICAGNTFCKNKSGQKVACVVANPETVKCPASSSCPDCKCNAVDETFTFSLEDKFTPAVPLTCKDKEMIANGEVPFPPDQPAPSCTEIEKKVKDFRLVSPECNQPAFNDDPLTFYCRQDWWNEPEAKRPDAIGNTMACGAAKEIPVGTTVDDAKNWAISFLDSAGKISSDIQAFMEMLQKISQSKDHCQCASTYEDRTPICQACCLYIKPTREMPAPSCDFSSCEGNSCQQMMDWLSSIANSHVDIKSSFIDLYTSLMADPRTDVLKELTYSRNGIHVCSANQNTDGSEKTRMLSCQKVLDDIVSPPVQANNKIIVNKKEIYHYCKGQAVGEIFKTDNTIDNWFCCEATVPIK